MPDRYEVQARYAPALLSSAPFVIVEYYFLRQLSSGLAGKILAIGFGGLTMTAALYQLASFSCRHVGKYIEERIYDNGRDFPTTKFLLDNDLTLSPELKLQIYTKINKEFKINLIRKASDSPENRRRIHEAVGQVRKKHFKSGEVLTQRNIYYGSARNMAGGSVLAIIASLAAVILSLLDKSSGALGVSVFFLMVYILALPLSIIAMRFTARHYAQSLFDDFLGDK